ncbi:Putative cell wall binding repeat-containing protein [Ruminococcaceae bacterium YRB3002]|nr:Putative cell wall binding repeat-containing protein [Ruminococcaceae bacterium YRB3002]
MKRPLVKLFSAVLAADMVLAVLPLMPITDRWNTVNAATEVPDVSAPQYISTWRLQSGKWYYYDEAGQLTTGFAEIGGKYYYFNTSGIMQTGWKLIDGSWHYFSSSGEQRSTGWFKDKGKWYYLEGEGSDCKMLEAGIRTIEGVMYKFDSSGALFTGWHKNDDGTWYYFTVNGAASGWKKLNGVWYYLDPETRLMVTGQRTIGGKLYFFEDSGAMMASKWHGEPDGNWYYLSANGDAVSKTWINTNDRWYYLGEDCIMYTDRTATLGGVEYAFDLYGTSIGIHKDTGLDSGDMLKRALTQLGNRGGKKFWQWAGLKKRCSWCALFVSWCADQAGLISAGKVPYFSLVGDAVRWYRLRDRWIPASEVNSSNYDQVVRPGMIIIFDWVSNGVREGDHGDHVGIVTEVGNGRIYTVEGNKSDSVARGSYAVGCKDIAGFCVVD